jgi:hypothetical protein
MLDKEVVTLARYAESQGWEVELTPNGHFKFYSPNGKDIVVTGGTASDHRSHKNFLSDLRRAGLVPPPKRHKKKESAVACAAAETHGIPFRDVDSLPMYPFMLETICQWRTPDWFDRDGFPLAEDEWGGPNDQSILAAILVARHTVLSEQVPLSDKQLRAHVYAVKYWGDAGGDASPRECTCGKELPLYELALHVYSNTEVGRLGHEPRGLRRWVDPEEVLAFLDSDVGSLEQRIADQVSRIADLEQQLAASEAKLLAIREALS